MISTLATELRRRIYSVASHNVHIAGGSLDWDEKCCTVVAWCKQTTWRSVDQSKEPNGSFSVACKGRNKVNLKHLAVARNCVYGRQLIRSLAEQSPLRPQMRSLRTDSQKKNWRPEFSNHLCFAAKEKKY